MHFLRMSRHRQGDVEDLCQEIYVHVYLAAQKKIPNPVKPFLFTIARNRIIDHARREQVIPIQSMADPDELGIAVDEPPPDRTIMARQELARLDGALDQLPPRYREAVKLSRIDGLTRSEIATRMGISEASVSVYLADGMSKLADIFFDGGKST